MLAQIAFGDLFGVLHKVNLALMWIVLVATVASLPVADQVPIHGVPVGPREASWRATAPHELFWIED